MLVTIQSVHKAKNVIKKTILINIKMVFKSKTFVYLKLIS